ncbi:methyl-accepting chemotaxis protein [Catenovulum sp. 2E275]|uniref:methyl-accepting chemotaxis protein n=1 Tax=Catenovulum sp. 2E275 TaxID=2980497 RepID=UPI0021D16160|nr:methyl-accepting chemotaxis protein [Catenovulum sp. 2E275]MCU4676017.1 methyl-accepting chemotaxis protein [Catenovulum sp. 2E275]
MEKHSLKLKLILAVVIIFITSMAILIWFSGRSLNHNQIFAEQSMTSALTKQAKHILSSVNDLTQQQISAFLNKAISSTLVLAKQLENTAIQNSGSPLTRQQVKDITLSALKSNPDISAMYAQFEANGYDNADINYVNDLSVASNTGTLDIYWVRETDEFVFYPTQNVNEKYLTTADDNGVREAEWYLCSYESVQPCLLDPYLYQISEGNQVLMTTFTSPIKYNNQFLGLVGIDINLPVIQQKLQQMKKSIYDGAGNITIVSQKGLTVASTLFPKAVANPLKKSSAELAELSQKTGFFEQNGTWYVISSINVNQVGDVWTAIISIDQKTVLKPATDLNLALEEEVNESAIALISIGVLAIVIAVLLIGLLIQSIVRPIKQVALRMDELSSNEGDLSQRLPNQQHAELQALAEGFNLFVVKLREMIIAMKAQKDTLLDVSHDIGANSKAVDHQSHLQQHKLDSVVTAMTEMAASATEVAQLAQNTADLAQQANVSISQSQSMLDKNTQSINKLDQEMTLTTEQVGLVSARTQDIFGILTTIRAIAEQTNLLALNAAIEAARAGEMGRGFAVVADEVRTLAARTQESTEEVDVLIKNLQKEVETAVNQLNLSRTQMKATVTDTQAAFESLVTAVSQVRQIDENTTQVATAAEEQSMVSEDISRSITEVGDAANQLVELAKTSAQLAQQSHYAVESLDQQLNRLKV